MKYSGGDILRPHASLVFQHFAAIGTAQPGESPPARLCRPLARDISAGAEELRAL